MPVTFACSCGRQMRAADEHAGKRVKCPGCDALNIVPGPAAALPPPPEPGTAHVRFNCACGKLIQAKAEHVGKLTRCPACGEKARIPAEDSSTPNGAIKKTTGPRAVGQGLPPGLSAADDAEELEEVGAGDDDLAGVDDRPKKKKMKGRQAGRKWFLPVLLIGSGVFLLLVLGGGGLALYFYMRSPEDMKYVPDDAQSFDSVRIAEVNKIDKVKGRIKDEMVGNKGVAGSGLNAEDVERATKVVYKVDNGKTLIWNVLLTTSSVDQKKTLGKMFKDSPKEVKHKDRTIYTVDKKDPPQNLNPFNPNQFNPNPFPNILEPTAVCFISDRILLIGSQDAIEQALDKAGGDRSDGPIARGVKLVGRNYHIVTAHKDGGMFGDGATGAVIAGSVSNSKVDMQIIAFYADTGKAQDAKVKAENNRKDQISRLENQTDDKPNKQLRAIRSASISQSGKEVTYLFSMELDKDDGGFGFPGL